MRRRAVLFRAGIEDLIYFSNDPREACVVFFSHRQTRFGVTRKDLIDLGFEPRERSGRAMEHGKHIYQQRDVHDHLYEDEEKEAEPP